MGHWENDWYIGDDGKPDWAVTNGPERYKPGAPFGPGGQYATQDPLNPGMWYADDPNVVGGMVHFDNQGTITNTFSHGDARLDPRAEGGTGWDLKQLDAQGNPTQVFYPQEEGGLFGLGPVWGGLLGAGLVLAGGFGVGALAAGLGIAPGVIGVGGLGAEAAAGGAASALPGALAAGELGLETTFPGAVAAGGGGALAPALGGGGALAGGGALVPSFADVAPGLFAAGPTAGAPLAAGPGVVGALAPAVGALAPTGAGALGGLAPYLPLVSAASGLVSAGIGAGAAKSAAQTQADAAKQANDVLWNIYQQNRADLTPYRTVGYGALADLTQLTANPLTYGPYGMTPTLDPSQYAFQGQRALDPSQYAFNATQYQFTPPSGQQVLNEDPGYQFRVQQGMKALEQTASARGGLVSGGQMKAAQQFGQDLASQEYQNAWQRAFSKQGFNTQLAQYGNEQAYGRALQQNQDLYSRGLTENQMGYERARTANETEAARRLTEYQTNLGTLTGLRNIRYNELAGLAGTGQTAAIAGADLGLKTGAQVGGNITSAGAAQAAGQVGVANAISGGLQGLGGAANNYLQYQLLNDYLRQRR